MISTWKEQRFWRFFPFLDKSSAVPLLGPLPPHYRYPVSSLGVCILLSKVLSKNKEKELYIR